jgi:hypothetical protein
MKIIINESQLRLIVENEEYINSIKELINTFDENNINMAFQIMKGMKIKQSVILDEYKELFEIFKLKPSKLNLIKMASRREVYVGSSSSVPDILFKMPNLKGLGIDVNNLGNLTSFDGDLRLYSTGSQINSLPKLESVGGSLYLHTTSIKDLGDLKYVGRDLYLRRTPIESLGNLESVGNDLYLTNTPLSKTTTEEEIRKQITVKGNIIL